MLKGLGKCGRGLKNDTIVLEDELFLSVTVAAGDKIKRVAIHQTQS